VTGTTQERLLDATDRLVRQVGMRKTSMADVARDAGVARATLYRYFESREVLLDALAHRAADRFFAAVAAAMDRRGTLSGQLGEFSEMMTRAIHPAAGPGSREVGGPGSGAAGGPGSGEAGNRAAMIRMLATESGQALRRTARLLRPYIEAARERGEVRQDLDLADASEWLARILLSFTIFQAAISYEADDPQSVSEFVRRYAINGLAGGCNDTEGNRR
jgi:AcrR family transcriptional regulator